MRLFVLSFFTLSCFGANLSGIRQPPVLAFEARDGKYVSRGLGYSLSVTSSDAVLTLSGHTVRMSVAGASPKASLEALDRMPGKANYLLGSDVRASYSLFGRVQWHGIYSGIDAVFRGNQEHLEYDFAIAAGRDPGIIKVSFDGVDDICVARNGDLVLRAGTVEIHQPKPVAYQLVAGERRPVDADYWIDSSKHVRFRTGAYDRRRTLVIDPVLVFDKTFGGSGQSTAAGLARDKQGALYVAGTTNSTDFPTLMPVQSHLATAPLLVTSDGGKTFSFPSLGSARSVNALAVAPSSAAVIYAGTPVGVLKSADGGTTWSTPPNAGLAAPVTGVTVDAGSAATVYAATSQGIFVSTDGAASWRASTNGIAGSPVLTIAAHPSQSGTVFASVQNPPAFFRSTDSGQTWSQLTFASTSPVIAITFDQNGAMILATYQSVYQSNDSGNIFTAGAAQGVQSNQGLAIAGSDLYLVSLAGLQKSTNGGQTFAMVLPSVHFSVLGRVAVDPRNPGTVYVADLSFLYRSTDAGQTWTALSLPYSATPFSLAVSPVDSRVLVGASTQNNVFVTKWSADGSQMLYSTYLGGSGTDQASGIAVDGSGSAHITGSTSSPDFPTTPGAFQTKLSGGVPNAFVAKLSADGSQLVYSTLIAGGSPYGIAVDGTGNALITGYTRGDYPVTSNAFQSVSKCTSSSFRKGDAYLTRIASDGKSLLYSTLLGGSCPPIDIPVVSPSTYGVGVAVDASGNAWISGATASPDFPVTTDALQPQFGGGLDDGFLARFNPSGGLDYATYLGGAAYDILNSIAFDQAGNVYLTGVSAGLTQPASGGAFQPQASSTCQFIAIGPSFPQPSGNALVLKLDPKGRAIQRLSYLGAPLCLVSTSIAVDSTGAPWISGTLNINGGAPQTASPLEIGLGQGFLSKFSADFTQLLFSTYFDTVAGVTVDSTGLAYIAGTSFGAAQSAYIAKIDPTPAAITLDSIVSAVPPANPSSFRGIAAGEVIRLLGTKMGPAAPTPSVINAGVLASNVAGVQVTFDGVAVPLLSVSAQEIDLVAPFELATKSSTTVQVQYNGVKSNAVQVQVSTTALQVLGVFNEDFSVNSASNPAQAGAMMTLYVAGAGPTDPPSPNGTINTAPLAAPAMPFLIEWFFNNSNIPTVLPITFAGAAPSLAAGIFQVNFVAPQQSMTNVSFVVGNASTFFNISVK